MSPRKKNPMPTSVKDRGRWGAIAYFLRAMAIIDLAIGAVVGLIALLLGWRTPYEFGTGLIWAGVIVIIIAGLTATGGLAGRAEDIGAYSLTGAGNMGDHLKRFTQHIEGSMGGMLLVLAAAAVLIGLGFLIEVAGAPG